MPKLLSSPAYENQHRDPEIDCAETRHNAKNYPAFIARILGYFMVQYEA